MNGKALTVNAGLLPVLHGLSGYQEFRCPAAYEDYSELGFDILLKGGSAYAGIGVRIGADLAPVIQPFVNYRLAFKQASFKNLTSQVLHLCFPLYSKPWSKPPLYRPMLSVPTGSGIYQVWLPFLPPFCAGQRRLLH